MQTIININIKKKHKISAAFRPKRQSESTPLTPEALLNNVRRSTEVLLELGAAEALFPAVD